MTVNANDPSVPEELRALLDDDAELEQVYSPDTDEVVGWVINQSSPGPKNCWIARCCDD